MVFERGGLPPLDREAQSLWPNWQHWCQGREPSCRGRPGTISRCAGTGRARRPRLPSNSRYRERITPSRSVKVKKTTTDEEADGREWLDQAAGKRKGMCCTEGRPAQRLKRVFFNGAA